MDNNQLNLLMQYGIDINGRAIYFGGAYSDVNMIEGSGSTHEVNQITIEMAVRAIHYMARQSSEPISIYLQSYGGDPYAMLYLLDTILTTPVKFIFYGGGAIMSSATWVMAVCDERYLYPHTRLLFHNGSTSFSGTHTDAELKMEEESRLQEMLEEIYAQNSKMPAEFWHEICKRDLFITAEEAVILGIADAIVNIADRSAYRAKRDMHLKSQSGSKELNKLTKELFKRIKAPVVRSRKKTKKEQTGNEQSNDSQKTKE